MQTPSPSGSVASGNPPSVVVDVGVTGGGASLGVMVAVDLGDRVSEAAGCVAGTACVFGAIQPVIARMIAKQKMIFFILSSVVVSNNSVAEVIIRGKIF